MRLLSLLALLAGILVACTADANLEEQLQEAVDRTSNV